MNKKIVLSLLGVGIIPLIIFYLYTSANINRIDSNIDTVRDIRSELISEISSKNARYLEVLLKNIDRDVSVLKFQAELLINKKDKNLDYIEGLAKRSFIINSNANRVFIITGLLSRNYSRSGISKITENDKNMFLKLVDSKSNSSKRTVWTNIYSDLKGNKFISCLTPVYKQNKFEGCIGIEINTSRITDKIINKDFKYKDSYAFIISQNGIVNYSNKLVNYLKNDDYNKIENRILKTRNGRISVKLDGTDKVIFFTEVNPVKWIFCLVVSDSEIGLYKVTTNLPAEKVSGINKKSLFILFIVLTALIVIAGLFISRKIILAHESEISHLTAKLAIVNHEVEEVKKQFDTYEVVKNDKQKLEEEYEKLKKETDLKIKNHEEKHKKLTESMEELKKLKEETESKIKKYIRVEKEVTQSKTEQKKIEDIAEKQVEVEKVETKEDIKSKPAGTQIELSGITDDVLIIEAREGNLKDKRTELYKMGYSVHLARGINDALDKVITTPYKFIVIDVNLNDDEKKKIKEKIGDIPAIDSSVTKDEIQKIIKK